MAIPSYDEILRRLYQRGRFGLRLGLDRMHEIMAKLGDPHRRFSAIHLAGTNGKGSTAAMISACLTESGQKTALYTSPHLCRFTERIKINDREISRQQISEILVRVMEYGPDLTFFEVVTAAAFIYFAEQKVDWAVIETGLGGRLDATNIIVPKISVITTIDFDHTNILGDTLSKIANEKAGIIKQGVPVVSNNDLPQVNAVIAEHVKRLKAKWIELTPADLRKNVFTSSLIGEHQKKNTALAVATLNQLREQNDLNITDQAIQRGLSLTKWPGRLEWIDRTLLDGAHNASGMCALLEYIRQHPLSNTHQWTMILGIMADKSSLLDDVPKFFPWIKHLILTQAQNQNALSATQLTQKFAEAPLSTITTAQNIQQALSAASEGDPILVTGSLYLVGEARAFLLKEECDSIAVSDPRHRG